MHHPPSVTSVPDRGVGAARLPLVIRGASDIALLRAHPRDVRRLPRGVRVRIDALGTVASTALEDAIAGYVRACGCGLGGASASAVLVAGIALIAWHATAHGLSAALLAMTACVLAAAIASAGVGKALGIALARVRFLRRCDEALAALDRSASTDTASAR